jgi:hypothetical protein
MKQSKEENTSEILQQIHRLQRAEQTKLQLTAALHLERIRKKGDPQLQHDEDDINVNVNEPETVIETKNEATLKPNNTITKLLEESIDVLRSKISLTVEEINDVLEELRYSTIGDGED